MMNIQKFNIILENYSYFLSFFVSVPTNKDVNIDCLIDHIINHVSNCDWSIKRVISTNQKKYPSVSLYMYIYAISFFATDDNYYFRIWIYLELYEKNGN